MIGAHSGPWPATGGQNWMFSSPTSISTLITVVGSFLNSLVLKVCWILTGRLFQDAAEPEYTKPLSDYTVCSCVSIATMSHDRLKTMATRGMPHTESVTATWLLSDHLLDADDTSNTLIGSGAPNALSDNRYIVVRGVRRGPKSAVTFMRVTVTKWLSSHNSTKISQRKIFDFLHMLRLGASFMNFMFFCCIVFQLYCWILYSYFLAK